MIITKQSKKTQTACQRATSLGQNVRVIVWLRRNSRRSGRILKHQAVKNKPRSTAETSKVTKKIAFNKSQS